MVNQINISFPNRWSFNYPCTTIHRYPIFSTRYSAMCKVYTGYHGTSEIEHGLCACTVDNPLTKARGLSLRIGAQTMLYLSLVVNHSNIYFYHFSISHYKTKQNKTGSRMGSCYSADHITPDRIHTDIPKCNTEVSE